MRQATPRATRFVISAPLPVEASFALDDAPSDGGLPLAE
jgi:hypothetical protein